MNCPSCSAALLSFTDPCPSCGRRPPVPSEGALAPDPLARLVPARIESVHDVPGRRKREPAWKDEVKQRVRQRRAQRLGAELPLFPETPSDTDAAVLDLEIAREPEPVEPVAVEVPPSDGPRLVWSMPEEPVAEPKSLALDSPEVPAAAAQWSLGDERDERPLDEGVPEDSAWAFDAPAADRIEPAPVERPAQWNDRLQAAAFDLGMLAAIWAVVVYFASRAARVDVEGLRVSWPYLGGYLAFLGIVYAVYFTGTCGRTIGKIVCGLTVVDVAGHPPGYAKAFARVILGTLGTLAGMLGLVPIFFDPARRAFHDRVLRTRVVKY